jgi:hypothetical protein
MGALCEIYPSYISFSSHLLAGVSLSAAHLENGVTRKSACTSQERGNLNDIVLFAGKQQRK